jgi:hypothetical protein
MTTPDPQYAAQNQPMGPPPQQMPPMSQQGYYAQQPAPQAPGYGMAPRPAAPSFSLTGGLWSILGLGLGGLLFLLGLVIQLFADMGGGAWYFGSTCLSSGLTILGLVVLGEIIAGAIAKRTN